MLLAEVAETGALTATTQGRDRVPLDADTQDDRRTSLAGHEWTYDMSQTG